MASHREQAGHTPWVMEMPVGLTFPMDTLDGEADMLIQPTSFVQWRVGPALREAIESGEPALLDVIVEGAP